MTNRTIFHVVLTIVQLIASAGVGVGFAVDHPAGKVLCVLSGIMIGAA